MAVTFAVVYLPSTVFILFLFVNKSRSAYVNLHWFTDLEQKCKFHWLWIVSYDIIQFILQWFMILSVVQEDIHGAAISFNNFASRTLNLLWNFFVPALSEMFLKSIERILSFTPLTISRRRTIQTIHSSTWIVWPGYWITRGKKLQMNPFLDSTSTSTRYLFHLRRSPTFWSYSFLLSTVNRWTAEQSYEMNFIAIYRAIRNDQLWLNWQVIFVGWSC